MSISDKELADLIEKARHSGPMTDDQIREQRQSFVFGNCSIENLLVTREMVIRVDEEMRAQRDVGPDDVVIFADGEDTK